MKKAILYIRVSTDEQAEKGFSLRDQKQKLINYAAANGVEVLKVFEEDYSAKTFNRPVYKELLQYVKKHKKSIDELLFTKWDRFSRNAGESYNQIAIFHSIDIVPNAIEQPLDLTIPEQQLMLAIYLAVPQVENERRSLNVTSGMRRSVREGRFLGGTPRGYTSIRDEKGKPFLSPNDDAKHIREAFRLYASERYSQREIREKLKMKGFVISRAQFAVVLKNPVYKGYVLLKKHLGEEEELIKAIHKAIISEELFDKVQSIISGRFGEKKTYVTKSVERFPLRGFIECHKCGNVLTASASRGNGGVYEYYHCTNGCKNSNPVSKVHEEVKKELVDLIPSKASQILYMEVVQEELKKATKSNTDLIAQNKASVKKLKEKIRKTQDLYIDGEIEKEDYKQITLRYKSQLENLADNKAIKKKDFNELTELLSWAFGFTSNLSKTFDNANHEGKRLLIGSIFPEKFTFENNRVRTNVIGKPYSLICSDSKAFERLKKKDLLEKSNKSCVVTPPRLELELTAPKTDVLPLHHGANLAANLLNFISWQKCLVEKLA